MSPAGYYPAARGASDVESSDSRFTSILPTQTSALEPQPRRPVASKHPPKRFQILHSGLDGKDCHVWVTASGNANEGITANVFPVQGFDTSPIYLLAGRMELASHQLPHFKQVSFCGFVRPTWAHRRNLVSGVVSLAS